jgi:hypothetical protein
MAAGLPGTGIGGIFYLASTFFLALRGAGRRLVGRTDPVPVRHHVHNVAMAVGILAGLWAATEAVRLLVPSPPVVAFRPSGLLGVALASSGGTLLVVLLAVELARIARRRPGKPDAE